MAKVVVYSTRSCGYCRAAESLLERRGIPFERVDVSGDAAKRRWLIGATGGRTSVPQIFVGDRPIGGYTDLQALANSGELDALLAG